MRVLLDTNILTRMVEPGSSQHRLTVDATFLLGTQGHSLYLAPQTLYEFWSVCTRPISVNGLGKSPAETEKELTGFKKSFTLLVDPPTLYPEWERLVTGLQVMGKNAHDARLVAALRVHNLTHLLTFNDKDFIRFGITILTPALVLSPTSGT